MLKTYLQKLLGEIGVVHAKSSQITSSSFSITGDGAVHEYDYVAPVSGFCILKATVILRIMAATVDGTIFIQNNPLETSNNEVLHKAVPFPVRKGDNIKISIVTVSGQNGTGTITYCPTNKLTL
jgi:hypothetical protein